MPDRLFAAARRRQRVCIYYVGLAVVVVILLGTLIAFYRTWEEIHEDEEPDSPQDLLESFRKAHAAGEIDDRELERVRTASLRRRRRDGRAHAGESSIGRRVRGRKFRPGQDSSDAAQPNGRMPRSV